MKKSLLIVFALFIGISSFAQETKKQKEVAIAFGSLNSFGLTYKFGKTNSLWRINTLMVSGNNYDESSDSLERNNSSFGFNLRFGKEFRKSITDKLELRYGADLFLGTDQTSNGVDDKSAFGYTNEQKTESISPGISLVFGFNYLISENLLLGAEMMPGISYTMGTITRTQNDIETKSDMTSLNYGLSNSPVLLTLAYRFYSD